MATRIANPAGPVLLGRQIRQAREALGKSQKALAIEAKVDRTRLTKIEAGQFRTLNPAVQKICTQVGINPGLVEQGISGALAVRLDRLSLRCPDVIPVIEAIIVALESRHTDSRRENRFEPASRSRGRSFRDLE